MVIITYSHHSLIEMADQFSILWNFKINADISILDKSVILKLPFCVFTGHSVLTYANDSLTDLSTGWNKNNQLTLESFFMTGYVKYC